jgi:hypothetical protein
MVPLATEWADILNASALGCPEPHGHREERCAAHFPRRDSPRRALRTMLAQPTRRRRKTHFAPTFTPQEVEIVAVRWARAATGDEKRIGLLRAWLVKQMRVAGLKTEWSEMDVDFTEIVTGSKRPGAIVPALSPFRQSEPGPRADAVLLAVRVFHLARRAGTWAALGILHRCPFCGWFHVTADLHRRKYCGRCGPEAGIRKTRDRVRRHRKRRREQIRGERGW